METTTITVDLYNTYGPLLFDRWLVLAMIVTWCATHFFKLSPFVQACKNKVARDWYIRAAAIVFGFLAVIYFKRGDADQAIVNNLAVFIAFANTALYRLFMMIVERMNPQAAKAISSRRRE